MTKIVLLADLHGNMPAALAMEKELEKTEPDEVWFLGDAVGKGPESDKTLDWVRAHCDIHIGGNWDYGISLPKPQDNTFYQKQLGKERIAWLNALPKERELTVSGICFRIFHGRPVAPLFAGDAPEVQLASYFTAGGRQYGGIICGDSHRPYIRTLHCGYAVNTGSVGNSLGMPKAHALLLEGEKDCREEAPVRFTVLSIPYDNEKAAQIARETQGLPNCEAYVREVLTGVYSR